MEKSTPLNHTEVREISRESLKYFELAKSENTPYQNLSGAMQAVLKGEIRALNVYIRKEGRSKLSNPTFQLKKRNSKNQQKSMKPKIRKQLLKLKR